MSDFPQTLDLFWPQRKTPQSGCGIIKLPDVSRHTPGMWTEHIAFQHVSLQRKGIISLVEAKTLKYIFGTCRLAKFYKSLKVIVVISIIIYCRCSLGMLNILPCRYRDSGGGRFVLLILSYIVSYSFWFRHIPLKISLHLQPWRKIWLFAFGLMNNTLANPCTIPSF